MATNMGYDNYEYDDGLTTDIEGNASLDSSWNEYSVSDIYNDCPELTVEKARSLIETDALLYSQTAKVYIGFFLPFLLCVGVIGNLIFLHVIRSMPYMRTATNWILANLAVADLIFLSFGIGDKLWMYHHSPFINDRFSFGEFGCPIIFALIDASYFAAICMVTLVSVERYYAVCRSHSARTNTRRSVFVALVVLSWIISIGIAASFVPASSTMYVGCHVWPDVDPYKNLPTRFGSCVATHGLEIYPLYVNIARTVPFLLLFTLNLWLNVCIVRGMTRAVRHTRIAGRADTNLKQRNQITRMLVVNGLIFFICLVPFEIFSILQAVNMIRDEDEPLFSQYVTVPLRYVAQAMSYINSVINPFIYIGMSRRYRDAFKDSLLCRATTMNERRTSSPSTTTTAIPIDHSYKPVDTKL